MERNPAIGDIFKRQDHEFLVVNIHKWYVDFILFSDLGKLNPQVNRTTDHLLTTDREVEFVGFCEFTKNDLYLPTNIFKES